MVSTRTQYYQKRLEIVRGIIYHCLTLLSLDFRELEAIPLSDLSDVKISIEKLLYSATKPRQIDDSEVSLSDLNQFR